MSGGGRMNWRRMEQQRRMRRWGVEDAKGADAASFMASLSKQLKLHQARADQTNIKRKQAAAAFMAWRVKRGQS
jgi:hypothetical protein